MSMTAGTAQPPRQGGDGAVSAEAGLLDFGFTEVESVLYCELLRSGAASGYRLAQRVGKAAANVYLALKTLVQKGAVVASEGLGEATVYSPTPPAELFAMMRHTFDQRRETAQAALEGIRTPSSDERVYSVPSVALVLERARSMLAQAEKVVLLDMFPRIYDLLRAEIDAVRARGVTVGGIAYEPRHADPLMPLNHQSAELVGSRWPGQGLALAIDGRQLLIAQVSDDLTTVLNAVWTDSAFLSCVFHSGMAADVRVVAMRTDANDPMQILTLQQSRPPGLDHVLYGRGGGA